MKASWPCEYLLLGLLEQQPMHGYDLAQRLAIGIVLLLSVAVLVIPYLVYTLRTETEI